MKRDLEITDKVSKLNDVMDIRHKAIDRVTAAHMRVSLLNRFDNDPVTELVKEEETIEIMEDAVYWFRKYLRLKLKAYEGLLAKDCKDQTIVNAAQNDKIKHAFDDGNKVIKESDFTREELS